MANAVRGNQLERRKRALRELNRAAIGGASVEQLKRTAAAFAMDLTGANGATVTRVVGDELVYEIAIGSATRLLNTRVRINLSWTGRVLLSQQPRRFGMLDSPAASRARAEAAGFCTGMIAPIMSNGHGLGTLGVTSQTQDQFDAADLKILAQLAHFLGEHLGAQR
jgi:hypothetical protein